MTLFDACRVAVLLACTLGAGAVAGVIGNAWLNLRDLTRTGHLSACGAPAGWACTCPAATRRLGA